MPNYNTIKKSDTVKPNEQLDRTYIWNLLYMLPGFGFFELEIRDGDDMVDTLRFSRNTDDASGRKALYVLLGKYPHPFNSIKAEFNYGFGFDLKVCVCL